MRLRPALDRIRRPLAAGMVLSAVGLMALPSLASAQEGVRTDTDLFGYNVKAEAAPLSVLFYEDFVPLPVDPGDAQFQATNAYTRTTLNLGPLGVGVASNFWPGGAVGDGYGTVRCGMQQTFYEQFFGPEGGDDSTPPPDEVNDEIKPSTCDDSQAYPYEARASYPGSGEDSWTASTTTPPNAPGVAPNMFASAKGLEVSAHAQGQPDDNGADENIAFGAASSESSSVVTKTEAIATARAVSQDIAIFSGLISIDSVETRLRAVANTETGSTSGSTTFSGVRFLGQPLVINENGVFLQPPSDDGSGGGGGDGGSSECPADDPLGGVGTALCEGVSENAGQITDPLQEIIDQFNAALRQAADDSREQGFEQMTGINIEEAKQAEEVNGAVARRTAGGLVVTINTPVLLSYLDEAGFYDIYRDFTNAFVEGFDEAWSQFPEEMREGFAPLTNAVKGYMVEFAGINPKVEYVFGRASVQAGGSAGFVFEPPTFTPPPAAIAPPVNPTLPNTPVTVPPPVSGGVETTTTPPAVAPPPSQIILTGSYDAPMFAGVPLMLAGFILLVLAAPTYGLATLRENAVGVNAAITDGSPLPDLRALRGGS